MVVDFQLVWTSVDYYPVSIGGPDARTPAENHPQLLNAQPSPACQSATSSSHLNWRGEYFTPWAKLQNKAVGVALLGSKSLTEHDWGNVPPKLVRPNPYNEGNCEILNYMCINITSI